MIFVVMTYRDEAKISDISKFRLRYLVLDTDVYY